MTRNDYKIRLTADASGMKSGVNAAKGEISSISSVANDLAEKLGGIFAGISVGAFAGKLVSVQREFDVLNSSLITVTGSSSAAARELAWIKEFAATTPYSLNEVTQAFVRMKSLGLDATEGALRSYGNTASAMGKSLDQMIEAVADASTGEFERLKEFGIRAKKEGDQVSLTFHGVTKAVVNSAAEISKYLRDIGDVNFGGAMAERAKTLDGALSNLGDTWDELFRTINDNNAGGLIYDSVKLATGAIGDAIDILNGMNRATEENAKQTGAAAAIQEGLAITFETVAVLGANLAYVLEGIGREIGGLAAQAAAAARFDFAAASAIGDMMKEDADAARAAIDQQTAAILSARANAAEFRQVMDSAKKGTADYNATVGRLIELQNSGKISAQEFRTAVESLQPAIKGAAKPTGELTGKLGGTKKAAKEAKDEIAELLAKLKAKEIAEAAKAVDDYNNAWSSYLDGLDDSARRLDEQIEQYGLTEAQIAQVTLRRAEERLEMARANGGVSAEYLASLEREVELRSKIAGSAGKLEAMDANKAAAEKAAEDWQRTAESIEDALIDALMEGGKSGREYIEGLFRTMVLRPIVQAIVQPVAGGITSALGFGGSSTSAGGLGSLNSLSSAWSALSGGMSASVGGLISGAGSLLGSSTLGAFGAGMQGSTLAAGLAGPTTAGASGAMGLGASFGSALPWLAGGLAIANALGAFKGPSYHSGAAVEYGTNNTAAMLSHMQSVGDTRVWGGFSETDAKGGAAYRDPLTALARGVTDTIESALSAFGSGGQVSAYAAFGADGKDASRGSLRIFDALGNLLGANSDQLLRGQKYSKDAQKGFAEFSADAGRVVRDALIAADLPAWVDDILGTIGDGASLDQLSAVIGELSTFAEQATDKTTLWQKATRNLYDEFAALGVEMPQTTAEFNKLIQGSGELGAELYALAPAFYELANVVDEVFASISRTTADSVRDIEMAVLDNAGKYGYLDNEIDKLLEQLNTAYDPTQIQSLFEQINAKTTQAFNLLDEGEQKRLATQFIDRLYEAESLAQSRLSVTPIDYQPQQDAAKAQHDAAAAQSSAAADLGKAATALAEAVAMMTNRTGDGAGALIAAGNALGGAAAALSNAARYSAEVG
ncbi:tape measure protein [Thauera propionica]|uniref:tape measure protein n=1 Tax=Thauera propionica TaxID=2019431 RepID=UPI0023F4CEB0|nr:tape measure protein [Thauera propionica]MDD3675883.1 tape measure protein [Thauera propionica]